MPIKPLSPEEAVQEKYIPDEVIQVVNDLLKERSSSPIITIYQKEVIEGYVELKLQGAPNGDRQSVVNELFNRHWLDFESVYQKAGWRVKYDKPGYNESYEAKWEFSKSRLVCYDDR